MDLFEFIPGYTKNVYDAGHEPALYMLLGFVITFILTRGYTRIARKTGWGSAHFGGVHAHHLVFGIIITLFSGALEFAVHPDAGGLQLLFAFSFGAGAALILDEFALIFHLEDVYWEREGRKSIDAVIIAMLFGIILLIQTKPLGLDSDVEGKVLLAYIAFNFLCVLVSALKGKIFFASFGVFLPILAQIGSFRLAEPSSIWARWFYKDDSSKMKKSVKRYQDYEDKWRPKKEILWDILGGKPGRPAEIYKKLKAK